ncbi:MAG: amidase family protein, partial [Nanoarchaeota archaeon]
DYHYVNAFAEQRALADAATADKAVKAKTAGRLAGVGISVKDCVCVRGVESTAGSDILRGYKPLFDATAVERAVHQGGMVLGKTAQDEFGFGGFSVNVGKGYRVPKHPLETVRSCGGSSGGAAGLTRKADFPHVAIAESTGGSITCPAAFCGVVGLCPTYGRVSRWGLIDYANSLDKIGSMAKTVEDAALLLEIMAGADHNDSTCSNAAVPSLSNVQTDVKGLRIGLIKEAFGEGVDPAVAESVKNAAKELEAQGAIITTVSLPLVAKYGVPCYYLIAMCEASTNLAKYCGMRYGATGPLQGSFNDYFTTVRTAHFGDEAKRRLMIGTFARMAGYRDAYYLKALKLRTTLINEYKAAFKNVDVLAGPTMPMVAPTFDEIAKLTPLQNYMADILTVGPNVAGLPHLSVPIEPAHRLPVGLQFVADHLNEAALVRAGKGTE